MKRQDFHSIIHNPGYDFIRELRYLNDSVKENKPPSTGIYFGPVIGVLFACFGIEGYINFVGIRTSENWKKQAARFESIKSRISRLFALKNKEVSFEAGVFKDVIDLFAWRKSLVHPEYLRQEKHQKNKIPDIFDKIGKHYPVSKSLRIANEFKDNILKEFRIQDKWQTRGKNISTAIMEIDA